MVSVPILRRLAVLAIDVNGLIVPGRQIEGVLSRHSLNLVVNNNDEVFKVSLIGSATAVRRNGHEILLTTQHQIRETELSQVAMLTESGSHVVTCGGYGAFQPSSQSDANDIAAFDFSEPCKERPELRKHFFDLSRVPPEVVVADNNVVAMLLSGYPSHEQNYDVHENNHLGLFRRQVVCRPHSHRMDDALLTVRAERPLLVHPDGMSGGSAFVIRREHGKLYAHFAGVIVRGGLEYFSILRAGVVCAFLDAVFPRA